MRSGWRLQRVNIKEHLYRQSRILHQPQPSTILGHASTCGCERLKFKTQLLLMVQKCSGQRTLSDNHAVPLKPFSWHNRNKSSQTLLNQKHRLPNRVISAVSYAILGRSHLYDGYKHQFVDANQTKTLSLSSTYPSVTSNACKICLEQLHRRLASPLLPR